MYIKIREKILIFFLLLFSIYCAIIIGESWDEAFHFEQGKITLNYLFSLGKINKDFEFSEYYSPSYWSFQYLVSQIFSSNYQIQIIHLVNLSVSLATIVGIGKLAKEFFNSEVGKITSLVLFFLPVFFGHMAFNSKDTILAFCHVWITYFIFRYLKTQVNNIKINKYIIYIGILAALGSGIQIFFLASLLPIFLIIIFEIFMIKRFISKNFNKIKLVKDITICFLIFYAFVILFWIDTHSNIFLLPFEFFNRILGETYWTGWPFNLVNGKYYFSSFIDNTYIIKNLIFKSPEYFLFLYSIFILFFLKIKLFLNKKFAHFNYKLLIILFFLIFPNLVLFLLPFPVYDGIRLFMWAIPYFCIIPALTVFFIYKKYKTLFSKTLFFSSLILFFFHVYNFILITPYQYTYLNIFNGNKEQRYKKFENDYWGGSIKELVKKTNFNKSNVIMISSCGVNLNVVKKYMNKKGYKKLNFVNVNSAQYILMTNRTIAVNANPKNVSEITNCFDKYPGKDVYSVKRNGQILSVIRELKKIN